MTTFRASIFCHAVSLGYLMIIFYFNTDDFVKKNFKFLDCILGLFVFFLRYFGVKKHGIDHPYTVLLDSKL